MNQLATIEPTRRSFKQPQLPVQYDVAVNALRECVNIDDAKQWNDKADALAAWARIYRSNDAALQARRLKLHAFRRMGQLAEEIQPNVKRSNGQGNAPGPIKLLLANGFSKSTAGKIRQISNLTEKRFEKIIAQESVPSPYRLCNVVLSDNPDWKECQQRLSTARSVMERYSAKQIGKSLKPEEAVSARRMVTAIIEWLDEFESALPKLS